MFKYINYFAFGRIALVILVGSFFALTSPCYAMEKKVEKSSISNRPLSKDGIVDLIMSCFGEEELKKLQEVFCEDDEPTSFSSEKVGISPELEKVLEIAGKVLEDALSHFEPPHETISDIAANMKTCSPEDKKYLDYFLSNQPKLSCKLVGEEFEKVRQEAREKQLEKIRQKGKISKSVKMAQQVTRILRFLSCGAFGY